MPELPLLAAIVFAGTAIVFVVGWRLWPRARTEASARPRSSARPSPIQISDPRRRLAVLPFSTSDSADADHIGAGVADELIGTLSRTAGIDVIALESVLICASPGRTNQDIADDLSVGRVLRGNIRRSGTGLHMTARLSDAVTDTALWSSDWTSAPGDLFSVQTEIARNVARALGGELLGDGDGLIHREPTSDFGAYDAYLRGRQEMMLRSEEGYRAAISHFEGAIELDALFPAPWSALASCYVLALMGHSPIGAEEATRGARAAAMRALELDNQLADPHVSLGYVELEGWNWPAAESHYLRALDRSPSHAGAHQGYALYLLYLGDFARSIRYAERALALDPLSDTILNESGLPYAYSGQVDQAQERARRVVRRDPENITAYFNLGCYAALKGKQGEAVTYYRAAAELSGRMPLVTGFLGMALAKMGDSDEAEDIAHDLGRKARRGSRIATSLGALLIRLGHIDEGLSWLETALEGREPLLISADTHWLPLPEVRDHPRFRAVLARLPQPCAAGHRP